MGRHIDIDPGILTTKDCWAYCRGRPIWEALHKEYGPESSVKILIPFRRTQRGDTYWLKKIVDKALDVAQAEGIFLIDPGDHEEDDD